MSSACLPNLISMNSCRSTFFFANSFKGNCIKNFSASDLIKFLSSVVLLIAPLGFVTSVPYLLIMVYLLGIDVNTSYKKKSKKSSFHLELQN